MNWDPLACVCVLHSLTVCELKYSKEVSYFQLDFVLVLLVGKFHIEELRNGGFKWRLLFLIDFRLFLLLPISIFVQIYSSPFVS